MDNTDRFIYTIYKDQKDNLYMPESIAYVHKISNKGLVVVINNEKYVQVNKEDIEKVSKDSNNFKVPQYKDCNLVDKPLNNPLIKTTYQTSFIVYTDQNNDTYVNESIAYANKITNKGRTIIIHNTKYIKVNKEDIDEIVRRSNNDTLPNYKKCKLTGKKIKDPTIKSTHQSTFIVYTDQNNKKYIIEPFAKTYKISNKGKTIFINNKKYIEINDDDIKDIMKKSEYSKIPEYKRCRLKEKEEKQISIPKYFTYFEIVDSKKLYINDEILKLCKVNNINLNETNKIIINKELYYEIEKDELDKLMKQTGYIGQKQSAIISQPKAMENDVHKTNYEASKEAALKKLRELQEMLKENNPLIYPIHDDILLLPESIKK